MDLEQKLSSIEQEFHKELDLVREQEGLDALRIKYTGKKGLLTSHLRSMASVPEDKRPAYGRMINKIKEDITRAISDKITSLKKSGRPAGSILDATLPGQPFETGKRHPITQIMEEIEDIFISMGFHIQEGPDVETEYYNFEALNIPPEHPSRDVWDTLYLKSIAPGKPPGKTDNLLLRTHTSPVQIRVMEKNKPPLAVIAPGKCYRRDSADASHFPVFHQIEGFLVDKGVSFAHLKGVLIHFIKQVFDSDTKLRFRPSFFPFTEPSAEIDISCMLCSGKGCALCKQSGWIEILGAGMIDPEVFRYVGYDSILYSGFAFGMGLERIAILKYGIDDIRLFFENDLRFLRQF